MSNSLLADRIFWTGAPGMSTPLPAAPRQKPRRVTGLTKSEAEDLLDWLQANGYREYQLSYSASRGFTVSFSNQ